MRMVICWLGVSGYLAASWRALSRRPGMALKIITFDRASASSAPFNSDVVAGLDCTRLDEKYLHDSAHIASLVAEHKPDAVVICGWRSRAYTNLPMKPALASVKFAMGVDTPRRDTLRQRLARFKIGRLIDRLDRVVVAGERAWQLMRYLGTPEFKLRRGMYGIDYEAFRPLHTLRLAHPEGWPRRFLYAGRYEKVKGVDILAAAYRNYRRQVNDPWPMTCCGSGELVGTFAGVEGMEDLGFVQPADQPAIWQRAGAFVLASRFDPWPLVVVEACAAGLPVLCTEACGSAVELVRSHYNGMTVATGDPQAMTAAMRWAHEKHSALSTMGARSVELAAAYSAERWADRWENLF